MASEERKPLALLDLPVFLTGADGIRVCEDVSLLHSSVSGPSCDWMETGREALTGSLVTVNTSPFVCTTISQFQQNHRRKRTAR